MDMKTISEAIRAAITSGSAGCSAKETHQRQRPENKWPDR